MTLDHVVQSTIVPVQRFFHWWGAELALCVPPRLRLEVPWAGKDLVLKLGAREAILGRDRSDGRFEIVQRLALSGRTPPAARDRPTPVRLRLAAEAALRLTIPLPAAALENLHEAVAFQLDRYTPFLPDQVYLACAPGERAAGAEIVPVATIVVERSVVADGVAQAQKLGFAVASVEVEREAGDPPADVLPVPELRRRSRGQVAVTAAAAILLLTLGAAVVMVPYSRAEMRAAAVKQQVAAMRAKAEAALGVEKKIEAQQHEASFLADRKRDRASALEILLELTRLAPDDTWLTSAQFSGTQVQFTGLSNSASGLIGRIEQSAIFRKAEFRSPVTPDQATKREHFVISAQIARGGTP